MNENKQNKESAEYSANLHYFANPQLLENARSLRKRTTDAEDLLWQKLRNKKLNGCKFRRQHAILKFVADFYCHEYKLVVEIDGEIHNTEEIKVRDENRTAELERYGLKVIRFTNSEILNETLDVLKKIKSHLELPPSP